MLSHCLLALMVSKKKSHVNCNHYSFFMISHFSCYFQDFLYVFHQFDNHALRCGSLWVYSTYSSSSVLDLWISLLHQIWGVSYHYFFKYSLGGGSRALWLAHLFYMQKVLGSHPKWSHGPYPGRARPRVHQAPGTKGARSRVHAASL